MVSIVIPGYVERWGYDLDKYQVYARFVLLDTVTGHGSQYQEGAFIIKARQVLFLLHLLLEELHGFVVGMAGPLHHRLGRNATGGR